MMKKANTRQVCLWLYRHEGVERLSAGMARGYDIATVLYRRREMFVNEPLIDFARSFFLGLDL